MDDFGHAMRLPVLGWSAYMSPFGDDGPGFGRRRAFAIRRQTIRLPGRSELTHYRQPGAKWERRLPLNTNSGCIMSAEERNAAGEGTQYEVSILPERRMKKRPSTNLQAAFRLGVLASGAATNFATRVRCSPPAMREAFICELIGFP